MMRCPKCDSERVKVLDSRPLNAGHQIRRRRLCECGLRFTTYESVDGESFREPSPPLVGELAIAQGWRA